MKRLVVCVLAMLVWPGVAVWGDEVFTGVEYISGSAALARKVKGDLVLTGSQLRFNATKGDSLLGIPLSIIKSATNAVEEDPGSTGRKMMLGVFAGKKEEFVYIHTESKDVAEVIVFKCRKKTSAATAAKIQFQLKRNADAAAAAVPVTPPAPAAPADSAGQDSTKGR